LQESGCLPVTIEQPCLISEKASITGDVIISKWCSIWPFASIRGDLGPITIAEGTSVQDCCVIHCSRGQKVQIGKNVTMGHGSVVHGAIIGDEVIVGMNASILDNAEIGSGCIIGAGSVVPGDMKIPEESLAIGVPAKIVRSGDHELREKARKNAQSYHKLRDAYLSGKKGCLI